MPSAPHIAVVDDNRSIRNSMQDLLNSAGYSAFIFENATSFLGSSVRQSADCLVTDLRMPGMTGLELHEHLSTSGQPIPTIVITAHPKDLTRELACELGITCLLIKPFTPEELLGCVRRALALWMPRRPIPRY
jgi:FixJ family two-component response regulator